MYTLKAEAMEENTASYYQESLKGKKVCIIVIILILILLSFISLNLGSAEVGIGEIISILSGDLPEATAGIRSHILLSIRLPRVLFAIISGMGLAIAWTVMQAVLRNPLASSYTLGVSSGAGFGAALAIGLGMGIWGGKYVIVSNAFLFGIISMFLVYGIARIKGVSTSTLILAGIAINYLFSALISIIKYISHQDVLAGIVFWLMGGLNLASWEIIGIILPLVLIPSVYLVCRYSWDLNIMSSGDEVAKSLGVHPERTRIVALILGTLITSGIIAFTGIIGFICLVGPHIARIMIGSDHRFLLPFSCLGYPVLEYGIAIRQTVPKKKEARSWGRTCCEVVTTMELRSFC